jgi:hypothetical protein
MPYKRKTEDEFELQADYGFGWECETTETTRREARQRLREYRTNGVHAPMRIKHRRIPIQQQEQTA